MAKDAENYIGLMSGTSMDGISTVIANFDQPHPALLASLIYPIPNDLRLALAQFQQPDHGELDRMGECDARVGQYFAQATHAILQQAGLTPKDIRAIGSHGQTIRHRPSHKQPFTIQIGDPNIIAYNTKITTVADFRRKDMAAGGQGAPLTPAFHDALFRSTNKNRIIVNIGGIANITSLCVQQPTTGFDTGPGNGLMDLWIYRQRGLTFDQGGTWAATGTIHTALLERLLDEPYFTQAPPKSTGRDYFNERWLEHRLTNITASPADIQATLTELTVVTLVNAIHAITRQGEILVCGGGVHNTTLMKRLQALTPLSVKSTQEYGVHPDWVEGMAFAWFAKQTLAHKSANLPAVTGAREKVILGGIYY